MDKILSIIIPTYNMEKYLHKCLSSLLTGKSQSLLDVMIINDGSKDSSLAIGREFEARYPETFRVIDKENGNYGSCINRGLKEAKGKYIKVLDADDSYDTKALDELLTTLSHIDVDICLTDYIIVDENGNQTGKHVRVNLPKNQTILADDLFAIAGKDIIEMHEITYRTENLRNIGYTQTEGIAFTDQEWILMPMTTVRTAWYLNRNVYRYLVGRQGQSTDVSRVARLQAQGDKSMFVQIAAYNSCTDLSEPLHSYMLRHLSQNLRFTYRTYLITAYKAFGNGEMKAFDEQLKSASLELYNSIDNETVHPRIPFHFIRSWRKNNCNANMGIKVYRTIVYPLIHKLRLG